MTFACDDDLVSEITRVETQLKCRTSGRQKDKARRELRTLKNRQSARKSRLKKVGIMVDLQDKVYMLTQQVGVLEQQVGLLKNLIPTSDQSFLGFPMTK